MHPLILLTTEQLQCLVESAVRNVLTETRSAESSTDDGAPLTIEQAAVYLKLSLSTLYRYTSQRLIPHHKPGKVIYFYRDQLDSWLMEHRKLTRKQIEEGEEIPPKNAKKTPVVIFKNNRKAS